MLLLIAIQTVRAMATASVIDIISILEALATVVVTIRTIILHTKPNNAYKTCKGTSNNVY